MPTTRKQRLLSSDRKRVMLSWSNIYVMAATLLSISSIVITSGFTLPSSRINQHSWASNGNVEHIPQCRPRYVPHPLFVQSKNNVKLRLAAREDLTETLEQQSSLTEREPSISEIVPARTATASEGAAIDTRASEASEAVASEASLTRDGILWRGVVVVLCALWASNFACGKLVMSTPGVDSSLYGVARFSLAALSLVPGAIDAARRGSISAATARGALACGGWVAFGYLGQLIGLATTTPSRACVICSLNCIFVAIVAERRRADAAEARGYAAQFDPRKLVPALIAVAGVAIVELKGAGGDPTIGDLICFAQPIGFGMGYLQLEDLMREEPQAALPVSAIKLAVVAAATLAFFEASPHAAADLATNGGSLGGLGLTMPDFTPILSSPKALAAVVYTGLVTTSAALYVESIAFQRVPATDASVILTTEPLFAAAVSAFLVGETFGMSDAIGASFIVGACIYAIKMGDEVEVCDEQTKTCVTEEI